MRIDNQNKKPLTSIATAFVAGLLLSTSAAAQGADSVPNAVATAGAVDTQITDELKLANEAFIDAYSARDIWGMGNLWSKEAYISSIFPAGSKTAQGWENVRRAWQQTFDHNRDIKIKSLAGFIKPRGDKEGDIAIILDSTQFEAFQTQTGQPVMLPNVLATKILERVGDEWRVVHYHAHQPGLKPPTAGDEEMGSVPLPSADAPEVRAAGERFYQALRDRDMDAMSKAWSASDDITAIQPEGNTPFLGRANVMASWKRLFDHNKSVQIPRVDQNIVHVAGNRAWIVGSYEAGLTRTSGDYVHLADVLTTTVFEKGKDGEWRMIHYHAHIGPLAHSHQAGSGLPGLEGGGATPPQPTRVVEIEATEMQYSLDNLKAKPGEVLRFVITNKGELRHEFSLGTVEEHEQMRAMMRQMPNMIHNTDTVVSIEPGETKTITWRVPDSGDMEYSCNIPGHSEGGMVGKIEIEK